MTLSCAVLERMRNQPLTTGGGGGIRTRVRMYHQFSFYKLSPCFAIRIRASHGQDVRVLSLLNFANRSGRLTAHASPLIDAPSHPVGEGPRDDLR